MTETCPALASHQAGRTVAAMRKINHMPNDNKHDLIPSLRNTIVHPMTDPMEDIGEIMIDSIFEDGLLKDIPIIRTIASFAKVGVSLRERNLAKNTYAFICGLRKRQIPQDKLENYRMEAYCY